MSKQILEFRAWNHKAKSMHYNVNIDKNGHANDDTRFITYSDKDVIMQLVEINEAFNRKVFVGDILKAYRRDDNARKKPVLSEVTFLNGCFMAFNCTWHELYRLWQSNFEVVGNICEHQKLLKA